MIAPQHLPRGKRLFSFAVVADTHVNEAENVSASPFVTNAKANARARHVFADIGHLDPAPDFVIHLGDIVHPVPSMPTFEEAARRFKDISGRLPMPLHLVPGNHDVGDKRIDWMPADIVCDAYLEKYREIFGEDYYSFDHGGVRFLIVNALLFNSGLGADQEQRDWIDERIASATGRVFVSIHYPPYLHEVDEHGSYDNIDEPGRGWLLSRLRDPRVEVVLVGHVHNFWYDTVGSAEMYMLPSTAFLRHDFSEFYRASPVAEFGRDDVEKFGYFVVDVYENGHVAKLIRTHGATRTEGDREASTLTKLPPVHTKTSLCDKFALEMRHPWAEVVEVPCTGGVQEFGRKLARNDYPLMAMWEMGLQTLKVPTQDFQDPRTLERARMMSAVGHSFILTSLGVPDAALLKHVREQGVRISAVEINLTQTALEQAGSALSTLREATDARLMFSKIRTAGDDDHFDGKHYSHFVNTGLRPNELDASEGWIRAAIESARLDGATVRLDWGTDLVEFHAALAARAQQWGCDMLVSVKLADRLTRANDDDMEIAALAAEAWLASRTSLPVYYAFDTFMDVDRGYFPRNGFIDRRFDPRPAAVAVASLNAVMTVPGHMSLKRTLKRPGLRVSKAESPVGTHELVYGTRDTVSEYLRDINATRIVDLVSGYSASSVSAPWPSLDRGDRMLLLVESK